MSVSGGTHASSCRPRPTPPTEAQNIGFAVPIDLVDGFLVEAVEPGSPAEQKGLQGGLFELTLTERPVMAFDMPGRRSGMAPAGFDRRRAGRAGAMSRTIVF